MALVLTEVLAEPAAPDWCFETNSHLEMPTCMWDGTQWHRSYESDSGVPGAFGAIFVLMLLVGVAMFAWRISLARRVARDTGMDPNRATELTILGDNGLEAGFLAGHLRQRPADHQPAASAVRSAEVRLRELAELRDKGLVTPAEYDARRTAIVDAL